MESTSPAGRAISAADFESAVLERSQQVPVLVDFMADWCHPCRLLAPILHQAVQDRAGKLDLVTIDIDVNPYLAAEFGVNGVPAVFLFHRRRLAGRFTGLMSAEQLAAFLDRHLPSPLEEKMEMARALLSTQPAQALEQLTPEWPTCLENEDVQAVAAAALLELGRVKEARQAAERVTEGSQYHDLARQVLARLDWQRHVQERGGFATCQARWQQQPNDPQACLDWGLALASTKRYEEALPVLLQAGQEDASLAKGPVKDAMVSLFKIMGPDNELANDFRGQLASLLY